MTRLARHLKATGWLRRGPTEQGALPLLMVLTSYETFCELRLAGTTDAELIKTLQQSARRLLSA
jgi:hypothetical protein